MLGKKPKPKILLISQWPDVKNGEYELIEKIKRTGYEIEVVDYLGFSVETGECLNVPYLSNLFDFAISFHYDTPKLLNIETYLWVANPLEFMHLRHDYRSHILSNLRSYDDFLYNGSDLLKLHIKNAIGPGWVDSQLEMYPSCSVREIKSPVKSEKNQNDSSSKIFYCGVNWERASDLSGRAHGILEILQELEIADFYGPNSIGGNNTWKGFEAYKGEIPFDGYSLINTMADYGAVLAVSSPAHLKSRTSSSRVFEGISAGVPVITDRNPHTVKLFGDSVYYFEGETEELKSFSIKSQLEEILNNPLQAAEKVISAQKALENHYSFEVCFNKILELQKQKKLTKKADLSTQRIDVFLLNSNLAVIDPPFQKFRNLPNVLEASNVASELYGITTSINVPISSGTLSNFEGIDTDFQNQVRFIEIQDWDTLTRGEQISLLAEQSSSDYLVFFDENDFPSYDFFTNSLEWFSKEKAINHQALYINGFFIDNLEENAPTNAFEVFRYNTPESHYRWTQNSVREHQLGSFIFSSFTKQIINHDFISRLDILLPISLICRAIEQKIPLQRGRHISLRVRDGYFDSHNLQQQIAISKGYWSQHYELKTNFSHEVNALYDVHHDTEVIREIIDSVTGQYSPSTGAIDPTILSVSNFLIRFRPVYRLIKPIIRPFYRTVRRISRYLSKS